MVAAAGLFVAVATLVGGSQQAAPPPAPFAPVELLTPPFPLEARLGRALVHAAAGEFEAAAGELAELAKSDVPAGDAANGVTKERVERDRGRLVALAAARRELLDRCVREQRKLRFKRGEQNLTGTLVDANDERLLLADAKGKKQELPITALDPEELLKKMSEQHLETGGASTRAFAALLAGRKNWAKGLEGSGEPDAAALASVAALKGDAPNYAALLATGRAVVAIEELARAPLPLPGPQVEATLTAISALVAEHRHDAVVVARREALRALARAAMTTRFDARGIAGAGLNGEVTAGDGGSVRIHYEFKTAAGLADFAPSDAQHPSWSAFEIKLPKAKWKQAIDEEFLTLIGQGCLRHRVLFATPVALEYHVQYSAPGEGLSTFATLRPAIVDDGEGTMVTNLDLTAIDAYRHGRRILESSDPGATSKEVKTRVTHSVRLEDDGKEARLTVSERPEQKIAAPDFASGSVALYWKSDSPVRLSGLTIEGRLAPDGLAALREAAVARDLAALFGE